MLSTPLIICSMGVATDFSTDTASAPTYVASRRISGGAMSGNRAVGSWTIAMIPRMVMRMEITIATIGRLMKKRAMVTSYGLLSDEAAVDAIVFPIGSG